VKKQHYCIGISPFRGQFGYRGHFLSRKSPIIAPAGRRDSDFIGLADREREKGVIKLQKNLVDFTSALYPVKYNPVISYTRSGTARYGYDNNSQNPSSCGYQNPGKGSLMRGTGHLPAAQYWPDNVPVVKQDLLRRSSYIRTPPCHAFFNDR
jgi:hypothetical protein